MSATGPQRNLLEVLGVRKHYATLAALGGVDLIVTERSFHGLVGPNGSGKSTLLKCIAGAEQPSAGTVRFLGNDITLATPAQRARAGMSLKFQVPCILRSLTVYDNVLVALQARDSMRALVLSGTRAVLHDRLMEILTQFCLEEHSLEAAGSLSHGHQQWLEIAMALACDPQLLLLDEPTAGMSPQQRHATGELLASIRQRCSLLIVEHDLDFIKEICDTLTVLDQGLVVDSGPTQVVQISEKVRGVYLAHA